MKWVLHCKDHHCGFGILYALPNKKASTVAFWLDIYVRHFAPPDILQMDNGKEFKGLCLILLKKHGIRVIYGRPRHPQTQGKVEQGNATFKSRLAKKILSTGSDAWASHLTRLTLSMNRTTTLNLPNKRTPFDVCLNRKLDENPTERIIPQREIEDADEEVINEIVEGEDPEMEEEFEELLQANLTFETDIDLTGSDDEEGVDENLFFANDEYEIIEGSNMPPMHHLEQGRSKNIDNEAKADDEAPNDDRDNAVVDTLLRYTQKVPHHQTDQHPSLPRRLSISSTSPQSSSSDSEGNEDHDPHQSLPDKSNNDIGPTADEEARQYPEIPSPGTLQIWNHQKKIRQQRQQRYNGKKSIKTFQTGDFVYLSIPKEDRATGDNSRMQGRIIDVKNPDTQYTRFKILTPYGPLDGWLTTARLNIVPEEYHEDVEHLLNQAPKKEISIHQAARQASVSTIEKVYCQCKNRCTTERCKCIKEKRKCTQYCHHQKASFSCTNMPERVLDMTEMQLLNHGGSESTNDTATRALPELPITRKRALISTDNSPSKPKPKRLPRLQTSKPVALPTRSHQTTLVEFPTTAHKAMQLQSIRSKENADSHRSEPSDQQITLTQLERAEKGLPSKQQRHRQKGN